MNLNSKSNHPITTFANYLSGFPILKFFLQAAFVFALIYPIWNFLGIIDDFANFRSDMIFLSNAISFMFYIGIIFTFLRRNYLILSISFGIVVLKEIIDFIELLDVDYDLDAGYYINVLVYLAFYGTLFVLSLMKVLKDNGYITAAPKAAATPYYAQPVNNAAPVNNPAPANDATPVADKKFCSKCGAQNNTNDNFCMKCGNPLS